MVCRRVCRACKRTALSASFNDPECRLAPAAARPALVLGGAGFIGSALRRRLAMEGRPTTVLTRSAPVDRTFAGETWIQGDFGETDLVAELMSPSHDVYHLVSNSSPGIGNWDVEIDIANTVVPTLRLIKAAVRVGVRKLIYVSSGGAVYGIPEVLPIPEDAPTNPISAYGIGKLAQEKYLLLFNRHHGLDCQILRVANPYGPGQKPGGSQGVVANLLGQALKGEPFHIWGDGSVARDFVHVDDVAHALVLASDYMGNQRVFNVGSGQARQIATIAVDIERVLGLRNQPRIHHESRGFDVPENYLDITRIGSETGWAPTTPWLAGLGGTAEWIQRIHSRNAM